MADAQGRDDEDTFDALKTIEGLEPLQLAIGGRKAFSKHFQCRDRRH